MKTEMLQFAGQKIDAKDVLEKQRCPSLQRL